MKAPRKQCKSCGAMFVWAKTIKSILPIDEKPYPDGNMIVFWEGGQLRARPAKPEDLGPRFKAHFSTCPQAGQHRRAR